MHITPTDKNAAARKKRWREFANLILPIVLRHKRDRKTLVLEPETTVRRRVYHPPTICPICRNVIGSEECRKSPNPNKQ